MSLETSISGDPSHLFFQKWLKTALLFFLIASVFGTFLRFYFISEIPGLSFRHILHAHSHLALMGWGFTVLGISLVTKIALPPHSLIHYHRIQWINVVAGVGMGVFFLVQGYGAVSIGFCTLHLLASYWFAVAFLKDVKGKSGAAAWLARWGVIWMVVSTLGLWAIGPIGATLGKLHPMYFASVQFFLHFQLNGWLIFGVLALLARQAEQTGASWQLSPLAKTLLQLSLLLTYALSITWSTPEMALFYLNSVGVVLQAVAYGLIFQQILKSGLPLSGGTVGTWLLRLGLMSLLLKVVVQSAVAIPAIAAISYTIRHFVIGFIHLTTMGTFSLILLGLLLAQGWMSARHVWGYWLLLVAFVSTELLLFGQGIMLWAQVGFLPFYHEFLFGCTALFPIALLVILVSQTDEDQAEDEGASVSPPTLKSSFNLKS